MNILFLNSIRADIWGGMEEWIRLVASGLASRGHSCTIAGRPQSRFLQTIEARHADLHLIPVQLKNDFSVLSIVRVGRIIRDRKIDIVVTNFSRDVRLGGIASKVSKGVPLVWSMGIDLTSDSSSHRFLTKSLVDRILVPSSALAEEVRRRDYLSDVPIKTIPIGLPDGNENISTSRRQILRQKLGVHENDIAAVTVGRLVDQKGHDVLLRAFVHIAATVPSLKLIWIGDGPNRQILEREIGSLGLAGRIIITGMREDVAEILSACDLMVHPSRVEPYGIALVEGLRAGLPVIASQVGGIPEVLGGAAYAMIEPENDLALGSAMRQLVESETDRKAYGFRSRERFEAALSYDRMITSLENYFEEVVGAH